MVIFFCETMPLPFLKPNMPADGLSVKGNQISSFLSVVCVFPVLAQVVLVMQPATDGGSFRVDGNREASHACDRLENHRIMRSLPGIAPPIERTMVCHQHSRNRRVIKAFKSPNDGGSGVFFVLRSDFLVGQYRGDGNRPVEVIGVRRTEARNGLSRLCPRGRVFG